MKNQRSQRKNDITKALFENYVSSTASEVKKQNNELSDKYLRNKFGENTVTYNKFGKRIVKIDDTVSKNTKGVFTVKTNNVQKTYDHKVDYKSLTYKNFEHMKSDIDKHNFDKMTNIEIGIHDMLASLIKQNFSDAVKEIDQETWNGKKIIFEVPENVLLGKLKFKLDDRTLNLNFYEIFNQENKKGKKIIAVNLFRTLNEFDKESNTRNIYNGYIIGGCTIAADKYNNNNWRIVLFVDSY